jgi:hypothetical protein
MSKDRDVKEGHARKRNTVEKEKISSGEDA